MEAQSSGTLSFLRRSPSSSADGAPPRPGSSLPLPAGRSGSLPRSGAWPPAAVPPLRSRSSLSALLPAWPALGGSADAPAEPVGARRFTVRPWCSCALSCQCRTELGTVRYLHRARRRPANMTARRRPAHMTAHGRPPQMTASLKPTEVLIVAPPRRSRSTPRSLSRGAAHSRTRSSSASWCACGRCGSSCAPTTAVSAAPLSTAAPVRRGDPVRKPTPNSALDTSGVARPVRADSLLLHSSCSPHLIAAQTAHSSLP